jgi:hypothetical protein
MDRGSRLGLIFITIPAAVIAGLLIYNVLGDHPSVERLAREQACQGRPKRCAPRMSRLIKTPLYHEVRYAVGRDWVDVRCRRPYVVTGDYQCRVVTGSGASP